MIEIEMNGPGVAAVSLTGRPDERPKDAPVAARIAVGKAASEGANHAHLPDGSPRRILPYGLAGVGVLGISGFAAFGLWGNSQKKDLERSCSPFCQSSDADAVHTKYLLADGCLVLGVASLAVATYLFAKEPRSPTKVSSSQDTSVTIAPALTGRGGIVDFATSF
jgi:hypothetical protein